MKVITLEAILAHWMAFAAHLGSNVSEREREAFFAGVSCAMAEMVKGGVHPITDEAFVDYIDHHFNK